jgi:cyclophilin family peptidyl-prolyl cis-trans isomerase
VRAASILCAGLLGLGLGVGCSEVDDPKPYQGSCPILLTCAVELDSTEFDAYVAAYAYDEDEVDGVGSCWGMGPNSYVLCRDSCVDALVTINAIAAEEGRSCGDCEADADCSGFGADARCRSGWCAQAQVGELEGGETPSETGESTGGGEGPGETLEYGPIDEDCQGDTPRVVLETSYGNMTLELDPVASPLATELFLRHLSANFYDGTIIHRVTEGVAFQGGAYGPGPVILPPFETFTVGTLSPSAHADGAIGMVVTNQKIGAQWYITDGPQQALEGTGPVFGVLVDGFDVRDAIAAAPVVNLPWMGYELLDYPEQDIRIESAYCEP